MNIEQIQENVKSGYAYILKRNTKKSFFPIFFQCCDTKTIAKDIGKKIGYSENELKNVPEDSNLT